MRRRRNGPLGARKLLLSWSSGKDSAWALHRLRTDLRYEVAGLLTTLNEGAGRVAMHAVRRTLLEAQAEAVALPLSTINLPWPCSNDRYNALMAAAVAEAEAEDFEAIAFGDLFLKDVRRYRETMLAPTRLAPVFPLWQEDTAALARAMISGGLRAFVTCVDPKQLDPSFAGRAFDAAFLADLPSGVDPCGENGEFHSFVWDGPMFDRPVPVAPGEIVERDGFIFADIVPG